MKAEEIKLKLSVITSNTRTTDNQKMYLILDLLNSEKKEYAKQKVDEYEIKLGDYLTGRFIGNEEIKDGQELIEDCEKPKFD